MSARYEINELIVTADQTIVRTDACPLTKTEENHWCRFDIPEADWNPCEWFEMVLGKHIRCAYVQED